MAAVNDMYRPAMDCSSAHANNNPLNREEVDGSSLFSRKRVSGLRLEAASPGCSVELVARLACLGASVNRKPPYIQAYSL